jgi:signal transduction histidine kinase
MKRILFLYIVIFSITLSAENDTVLKIGLPDVPGLMYRNHEGIPTGIPLEVTAQAFEDEKVRYKWIDGSWSELYEKLKEGEIDLLPGMMLTEERDSLFDILTNDFYLLWSEIYIHNDTDYYRLHDFSGKKIGLVRNDQNANGFDKYIKEFHIKYEKVWFDSHKDAIEALKNKEIYGFAGPNPNNLTAILQKDLKRSGLYFNPTRLSIAFVKGRYPEIRNKINKRIGIYKEDPNSILNNLINYYRVSHISPNKPFIPDWLYYLVLFSLLGGLISLLFIVMLRKQVKNKTSDLILAKQKAEESERLKSQFLANMSHEIRTPLNSIVGFSNIMSDPDISNEEMKYYSDIISSQSEMLLTLINDIVDYAKIESNSLKFKITKNVSIIELLEEVYDNFKFVVPDNIYFLRQFSTQDTLIDTDRLRLQQIINNFVSNAFKHTLSGTVVLGYELINGVQIKIYVKDEGEGLSVENQKIIFDRFFKTDDFSQGAGLGLPISKAIAEYLGYKIGVDSTIGLGSQFYIIIDLKK